MITPANTPRIGVYVCRCGTDVASKIDVLAVAEFCRGLPGVVFARDHELMCSDSGREMIKRDVAEHRLNRIVVAACSPLLHEQTFRKAAVAAGLNPFLVQIANLREHVAWVTECPRKATEKAKAHLAAAVRRVVAHESLPQQYTLVDGERVALEPGTAWIDENACSGCKTCLSVCVFSAIHRDSESGVARIDEAVCKGCGTCVAACPTGAAQQHLFTSEQVYDEIEGIMHYV
ncbi:MAG TPA: 4Fe-4S binding protein [Thermoguttaceae bacterium]|nr:4Fe-4S binding protein [Thermoguttaceae bacterium]